MPRPNVPDRLIEDVESIHEERSGYEAGSFQEALATVIDSAAPELVDEVGLLVAKGYPEDSGENVVRLHRTTLRQLDVGPGAFVEIRGDRTTVATARETKNADRNPERVRMDGFVRENAGVDVGECVRVQRADGVRDATEVTLDKSHADADELDALADERVHDQIVGRPLSAGDIVPAVGDQEGGSPAFPLAVRDTDPSGPVVVREETTVNISTVDN